MESKFNIGNLNLNLKFERVLYSLRYALVRAIMYQHPSRTFCLSVREKTITGTAHKLSKVCISGLVAEA